MILKYKYGFEFNGVLFGWKDKELYRLPQMIGKRFYPLKKCGSYEGGYHVCRKRKSIQQLKSMTHFINFEVEEIESSDCPF